jgi:mycofactocin system FadH/OYE family oxidoreductase 1
VSGRRLADSVPVGRRQAPSRVVFGPHETNLGDGRAMSSRHTAYYARRAEGGAGIIITESASVTEDDWPYERAPLASAATAGWRHIKAACTPFGTLVLAGLGHAGAQGSSAYSQSVMWAPSRVADVISREPPADLDTDGIEAIVHGFARAAARAQACGLDGVEIDAGAWSLLRQFHSGLTNLRADPYGQDRLLFTRQVLEAVRTALGRDGIVALRLSCDELAPWAGITPEQATGLVAALAPLVDLLTVVRGGPYSTSAYRPDAHAAPSFNWQLCRQMYEAAGGATSIVFQGSLVAPGDAESALGEPICDLVEMTRAQIADARLVAKVRAGHPGQVRPCILCNQACRVRDNRNPIVSCVVDPSSGYETAEPAPADRLAPGPPVLIVGAGPAGLECARVLAGAGRRVRIAERSGRAGGAVVAAARGAGRETLRQATDWLEAECRRLGVELTLSAVVGVREVEAARSAGWAVVLATGGRPFSDRYPQTDRPVIVDAASALLDPGKDWPAGPIVVYDPVGDAVAISIAERLAREPARSVTLICPDPTAGTQLARTGDLADANVRLQRAGVHRVLRSRIRAVGQGRVEVDDAWTGEGGGLDAAVFVDCGHRLPEDSLYQALADISILRAGDCVAPRSILEAVLEGRRVAAALLGVPTPAGVGA